LLKLLIEDRGDLHREASRALHSLGKLARSAWQSVLDHPDSHIRWHAARALGEMGDTSLAMVLAEGLRDDDYVVRWATADVLARLGEIGLQATLKMLTRYPINEQFRQAAYHALHGIVSSEIQLQIKPLLASMRGPAAGMESARIARNILVQWEKDK
jgi:HEAT repeat protein